MKIPSAVRLIKSLMKKHGIGNWEVMLTDSAETLGKCFRPTLFTVDGALVNRAFRLFAASVDRYTFAGLLQFSRLYLRANNERAIEELALHEIAHALTEGRHGAEWRRKARKLGATGLAHARYTRSGEPIVWPRGKYVLVCPVCAEGTNLDDKPTSERICRPCYRTTRTRAKLELRA